jgi:hypothetical protein
VYPCSYLQKLDIEDDREWGAVLSIQHDRASRLDPNLNTGADTHRRSRRYRCHGHRDKSGSKDTLVRRASRRLGCGWAALARAREGAYLVVSRQDSRVNLSAFPARPVETVLYMTASQARRNLTATEGAGPVLLSQARNIRGHRGRPDSVPPVGVRLWMACATDDELVPDTSKASCPQDMMDTGGIWGRLGLAERRAFSGAL